MCTLSGWDVCLHASVLIQSNKAKKNFCCVWIAWYTVNTQVGGILKSLYATCAGHSLQTLKGFHNCLEFSQPFSCLYQAMQTQKKFFYYLLEYNLTVEPVDKIIFTYFR